MRQTLEHLMTRVERIDGDNLYQAVADFKDILYNIIENLEQALPIDRSDDV